MNPGYVLLNDRASIFFLPPSTYHNELLTRFQATLAILDKLDIDSEKPNEEEVARMFGYEEEYLAGTLTPWQRTKPKLWALFNEPHSSLSAKVSATKRAIDICIYVCALWDVAGMPVIVSVLRNITRP